MKVVCSWCGTRLSEVDDPPQEALDLLDIEGEPISHGMCEDCAEQLESEALEGAVTPTDS